MKFGAPICVNTILTPLIHSCSAFSQSAKRRRIFGVGTGNILQCTEACIVMSHVERNLCNLKSRNIIFERSCMPEVLGSNLGRDNSSHDRFLPNPFQLIIYVSSYHSTLYSLATESVVKQPTLNSSRGKRPSSMATEHRTRERRHVPFSLFLTQNTTFINLLIFLNDQQHNFINTFMKLWVAKEHRINFNPFRLHPASFALFAFSFFSLFLPCISVINFL
jgi:hypothetical protein